MLPVISFSETFCVADVHGWAVQDNIANNHPIFLF
jgi:hypothetical protein